jgi:chromate reductase, NAD(P)H dehydrogenase (quinone)
MKVLSISGSLRAGSYNSALLRAAVEEAPEGIELVPWDGLKEIPPYDQDDDVVPGPAAVEELRDAIRAADAVLFATPEYNSSIPGALKNAIDWVSRMKDQPFKDKPVAIQSCSQGPLGGSRMQYHMRMSMTYLAAFTFGTPEVIVSTAQNKFDKDLKLTDETTRNFVKQQLAGFAKFIERVKV